MTLNEFFKYCMLYFYKIFQNAHSMIFTFNSNHRGSLLFIILFLGSRIVLAQEPIEVFKPSGKVWGYAFADAYYKASGDTATWASRAEYSGVPDDVYAFAVRRMYLGYDYNISPTFSTSVLLEGNDGIITSKGDRSVTIKALNIRWKEIYKGADLVFGQTSTLAFSMFSEKVWNYRSIEKTITDMRGIRSSSDLGIALHGRLDSAGTYGYNFMIGNGTATRPEDLTQSGKHKIYSGDVFAYFLDRKIILDLYADYQTAINDRNFTTLKGFIGYQTDPFTIGVELLTQQQSNAKSDQTDIAAFGFSVFARSTLIADKLNVFARFDSFNPDRNYREADILTVYSRSTMLRHYDETFFVAGLDIMPHRNVHIMPNIWINSYSAKGEADLLPERDTDIVPRLTVFFIYR